MFSHIISAIYSKTACRNDGTYFARKFVTTNLFHRSAMDLPFVWKGE
jgi:hypothetical protein